MGAIFWVAIALLPIQPAQASFCRTVENHRICIVEIKRSAKNYWEYRAVVSVDGKQQPQEVYNCRDRTHTQKDGRILPFIENGAGEVICQLLQR